MAMAGRVTVIAGGTVVTSDGPVRADLVVGLHPVKVSRPLVRYRYHATPRLHNESVKNIEKIRKHIRNHTKATAVLRSSEAAA